MKTRKSFLLVMPLLMAVSTPLMADVVMDWNDLAVGAGSKAGASAFVHTRNVAIANVSIFEAVNAIDRRYTPYRLQIAAVPGASREAAAAAAAHLVLVRLYPDQAKDLDAAYQTSLAPVSDGAAKAQGIQLGEQVAAQILALRANDGSAAPNLYRPHTTPGAYVPTVFPVASSWGKVMPFGLKDVAQFRPGAPTPLQGAQWARDYDEVKRLGAKTGSARSAEQTDIARLWEATGPGLHNQVLQQLAMTKRFALLDNARLFALYSMAMADSYIAVFDAKYAYNFWRPVTAIRNGDIDGNDATARDPGWEPFVNTPMHPEYPCAHCINSAAGAAVLEVFFGDSVPEFTLTSSTGPGVVRKFTRLSDYTAESIEARIYDGVHYRTSGVVGAAMGRQVGKYVVENNLKPAK